MRISYKDEQWIRLTEDINRMVVELETGSLRIYLGKQCRDGSYSGGYITEEWFRACQHTNTTGRVEFLTMLYEYIMQHIEQGAAVVELDARMIFDRDSAGHLMRLKTV